MCSYSQPVILNLHFFCLAQQMKRGKKLHQGLDISVRSTNNNRLMLQWDWTPSIMNSGFKVWYSVLVLGTKFGPNINSHKRLGTNSFGSPCLFLLRIIEHEIHSFSYCHHF